ncbi:MAG: AAA family ATPase [Campylobacterales bacterium]|nr:AAA family ATPase [Campylobacterales bacterium]
MKIRELYIENYKMFRDFKIDFLDSNNQPLDIVVVAGVNGSGKTALLELLYNIELYKSNELKATLRYENHKFKIDSYKTSIAQWSDTLGQPRKQSDEKIYIPVGVDSIEYVSDEFVKTFYHFLKEKDYRPSEITKHFRNYIKNIFNDLDLGFEYSHLDKEDNVWFTSNSSQEYYYTGKDNSKDDDLFTINELSTGQKTLLSKVLYLYFKDYKDKVILIDEPELSLHPSWQNRVLKIYENFAALNNCQIIIATHSPHIIGSAKNESLRILHKNSEGEIEVIKDLKAHGRDINSVLFDVMGEVEYRPKSFRDKIDRLHIAIDDKNFDEASVQLNELKKDYGENDAVIIEAQMLIDVLSTQE